MTHEELPNKAGEPFPKPPSMKPHLFWQGDRWHISTWGGLTAWDMQAIEAWCWMVAKPEDPDRPKAAAYLAARCRKLATSIGPIRTMTH